MQPAQPVKALSPSDQAVSPAMAHFTLRAAPPTPLHLSQAPAAQREKATAQCLLPRISRARTATGMEMRRRRCWPKVTVRVREAATPCTAQLTPVLWREDMGITVMVRLNDNCSTVCEYFRCWFALEQLFLSVMVCCCSSGWGNQSSWGSQQGYDMYQGFGGQNQGSSSYSGYNTHY